MKETDSTFAFEKLFTTLLTIIHRKYNLRLLVSGPPCKEPESYYSINNIKQKSGKTEKYQQFFLDLLESKVTRKNCYPQNWGLMGEYRESQPTLA